MTGAGEQLEPKARILEAMWSAVVSDPSHDPSIRQIAGAARVNPAMVSYYFDGKDGLLAAMFLPHAEALARERLGRLAEASKGELTLERVLAAWMAPDFGHPDASRSARLWEMMRLHHAGLFARLFSQAFDEGNRLFLDTLSALLPDTPRRVLTWRLYAVGQAALLPLDSFALQSMKEMRTGAEVIDIEVWRHELLAFAIAGFRASPAAKQ